MILLTLFLALGTLGYVTPPAFDRGVWWHCLLEWNILLLQDDEWYEQATDVRSQLKFFEQLERLEKQRKDEQEREILLKAAKVFFTLLTNWQSSNSSVILCHPFHKCFFLSCKKKMQLLWPHSFSSWSHATSRPAWLECSWVCKIQLRTGWVLGNRAERGWRLWNK